MRLSAPLVALLAVAQPSASPPSTPSDAASALERLEWNARERTAAGRSALEAGRGPEAIPAFDTALRLAPADPIARFNAGTARLGGDPGSALALLEQAAASAPPELAPSAWYNLGNGRLATGNAQGAVDAYVEALRRQPEHANAKVNLELALRELARQRAHEEQQEGPRQPGESQQERQQAQAGAGSEGPSERSRQQASDRAEQPQPSEPRPTPGEAAQNPSGQGQRSLPQFHDLPDMTAEQAAAILRAVENLERQQRRERAAKQALAPAQVEIDW